MTTARIFNVVGPGQDERHVCGRFAAQASAITAGLSKPVFEVGDLTSTRDFVDVRDVASAITVLAGSAQPGIYNVASGVEHCVQDVLGSTLHHAGIAARVQTVVRYSGPRGVTRQQAAISRLTSLGYRPAHDLASSIKDTVEYYRDTVGTSVAMTSSTRSS